MNASAQRLARVVSRHIFIIDPAVFVRFSHSPYPILNIRPLNFHQFESGGGNQRIEYHSEPIIDWRKVPILYWRYTLL